MIHHISCAAILLSYWLLMDGVVPRPVVAALCIGIQLHRLWTIRLTHVKADVN